MHKYETQVKTSGWVLPALGLIFIVLKLIGVIAWSWWWVLAPFWIPMAFMLLIVIVGGLAQLLAELGDKR